MAGSTPLTLIPCRPHEDDARRVMEWRNDPLTLSMFYHRDPKRWATFWPEFRDTYFRHDALPPLFAVHDGRPVAFLRFLPLDERPGWVDVSINVAPHERGNGFGISSLLAGLEWLRGAGILGVVAEVRVENVGSCRAFLGAGFQLLGETDKLIEDTGEVCRIKCFIAGLEPSP